MARFRSGLEDNVRLTKVPPPEMFERASPLTELTEDLAMKRWHKDTQREPSEPSLSHFSLSHDLPDSASINEKL
jgi:hypothetical protein